MTDEATDPTHPRPLLEVCCGSARFAAAAVEAGAHRVELCDNLVEGGTTPSAGAIAHAMERVGAPVMAMIRPRGGDFLYCDDELKVMLRDIGVAKDLGVAGVVFGALEQRGCIDREGTERLFAAARPLSVTFHRAFDLSRDLMESLEVLMEIGVDRVLTSAGKPSVLEGVPLLGDLVRAAGEELTIMPGGGVRPDNVDRLFTIPGIREVHIGASRTVPSAMTFRAAGIPMGHAYEPDEYVKVEADDEVIREVSAVLGRQRIEPIAGGAGS